MTAEASVVACCITLALYNAIELLVLIYTTFKHYNSLYFWSLLVASAGVIPYSVGYVLVYFDVSYDFIGYTIDTVGWCAMVTGQSVVLYSRLHLVLRDRRILRAVVWMIMIDAVIFHVPTTVMLFGSRYAASRHVREGLTEVYKVYEKVQMTGFEIIISGIYVNEVIHILNTISKNNDCRRTIWQLLTINVLIIFMDVGLLAIEYRDLRVLEQTVKGVVYSVKLKLEFAILGKLVEVVKRGNNVERVMNTAEFVDWRKVGEDMTHAPESGKTASSGVYAENVGRTEGGCEASEGEKIGPSAANMRRFSGIKAAPSDLDDEYAEAMRQISR